MEKTKSKFDSLTIQGSIMGILPAVYAVTRAVGLELPIGSLEGVVSGLVALMSIATVVMTYIGRMRAEHKLT